MLPSQRQHHAGSVGAGVDDIASQLHRHLASAGIDRAAARQPAAGKRALQPAAGKRALQPAAGKRALQPAAGKRALQPDAGTAPPRLEMKMRKRSGEPEHDAMWEITAESVGQDD